MKRAYTMPLDTMYLINDPIRSNANSFVNLEAGQSTDHWRGLDKEYSSDKGPHHAFGYSVS